MQPTLEYRIFISTISTWLSIYNALNNKVYLIKVVIANYNSQFHNIRYVKAGKKIYCASNICYWV